MARKRSNEDMYVLTPPSAPHVTALPASPGDSMVLWGLYICDHNSTAVQQYNSTTVYNCSCRHEEGLTMPGPTAC